MANLNAPLGFVPIFKSNDCIATPREYLVDSSNATAMAKGDLIVLEADGNCGVYADSGTTAVVGLIGSFDSCRYTDGNGKLVQGTYLPASTAATIYVYDDKDQEYLVQCDPGGSVAVNSSLVGENVNILASQAPVRFGSGGHSTMQLDTSTHGTLTTVTCHIKRLWIAPDNVYSTTESASRYAKVVATLLNHFNQTAAPASGLAAGV